MKKQEVITDIDSIRTDHQVVYRHDGTIIDDNGEVITSQNYVIKKERTKEGFIKLFVENLRYLVDLDNNEKMLFFLILSKMDYRNIIFLDKNLKSAIIAEKYMSRATLYRAINGLVNKQIIIKLDPSIQKIREMMVVYSNEAYLVNPNLVGKGGFRDLRKLRHTVITDFDFDKLEMRQAYTQETEYDGLEEILQNPEQHEIKSIEHTTDARNNSNTTEILVGKKAQNSDDIVEVEMIEMAKSKSDSLALPHNPQNINKQQPHAKSSLFDDEATNSVATDDSKLTPELKKIKDKVRLEIEAYRNKLALKNLEIKERLLESGLIEEAASLNID